VYESASGTRTLVSVLPFTLAFLSVHLIAWFVLIAALLFYVPRSDRLFRDFNMTLPATTTIVVYVSRWACNYWYVLPLWIPFWLAADGVLLAVLRRRRPTLAWAWGLLNSLLPLLFLIVAVYTILVSVGKLLDGISN